MRLNLGGPRSGGFPVDRQRGIAEAGFGVVVGVVGGGRVGVQQDRVGRFALDFDSVVEVPVSVVVAFDGVVVEPLPEPLDSDGLDSLLALGVGVGAVSFGGLVVEDGGNSRLPLEEL